MRSARVFLLLGLVAATIILLVSSEVAARDLTETSTENGVNDAKHDGYGGGYPGGGGGYPGHGGGYPGRGGRCRYGCCGSGYYGRCRCCASTAEAEQQAAEVKPQN